MDATAPAAVKVSIKVMKEIIRRAGLSTADLLERHDVEARYAQAEARLAEAERLKNQSKKRGHVAGSSGDDGPMTPEALGKKKSKVATTCVSSGRFSNCASQENVAHEPIDLAGDASDGHRTSDDEDEDDDAAHKRAERLLSECGAYAAKLITELRSAGLASSTRHGALCAGEMVSSNSSTDFVPLDQAEVRRCCGPDLKLRQHQIVGVNWLLLLERVGANGVLADDMGLGKTIQTIAYLAASRARKLAQNPSYQGRDVVVVPASTLGNWQREFARWAPYEKRVVVYHGSMKERHLLRYDQDVTTAHVILTTYTWWEREDCEDDRSFFKHYAPWAHVVLDEGHNLRNPDASRSRHLRRLGARSRTVLSGTPIMNRPLDLLSILLFLMPDLFRDCRVTDRLEEVITAMDSVGGVKKLRELLAPFCLRRVKQDVLQSLPPKTSHISKQKRGLERYSGPYYFRVTLYEFPLPADVPEECKFLS